MFDSTVRFVCRVIFPSQQQMERFTQLNSLQTFALWFVQYRFPNVQTGAVGLGSPLTAWFVVYYQTR